MPTGVYARKEGINYGMKGKHHSGETKEKLRNINLGKKLNAETIKKLRGRKISEEHRKKISIANKGRISWCKGLTKFNNNSLKIRSEQERGKNSSWWKGDNVGRGGVHSWIHRNFGKADRCENPNCVYPRKNTRGKLLNYPKIFQWSNKEHTYKRKRKDWIRLCCSCHTLYDNGKLIINFK